MKTVDSEATEEWRDIKGYEGYYQISSLGRVRSLTRVISGRHRAMTIRGIHRKTNIYHGGYIRAALSKAGKIRHISVHRLVAMAFIDNINNCAEVNHLDGDKSNNCVSNLKWCTPRENMSHAKKMNLIKSGSEIQSAVLSKKQVIDIVEGLSDGFKQKDIARHYGVHVATISKIARGLSWVRVTGIVYNSKQTLTKLKATEKEG